MFRIYNLHTFTLGDFGCHTIVLILPVATKTSRDFTASCFQNTFCLNIVQAFPVQPMKILLKCWD